MSARAWWGAVLAGAGLGLGLGCGSDSTDDPTTPPASVQDDGGQGTSPPVTGDPNRALIVTPDPVELIEGQLAALRVKVERSGALRDAPVALTVKGLPPEVTAPAGATNVEADEVSIPLTLAPGAKHGARPGVQIEAVARGESVTAPVSLLVRGKPGTLDNSFGEEGVYTTKFGISGAVPRAIVVLDDGKIVVGGERNKQGHYEHGIVRLLPEGKLDEAFGNKGVAAGPEDELHHGMFVQKDGKIVTCGQMQYGGKEGVLRRLTPEGAPDPTFGSLGEQKYTIAAYPQLDVRACAEAPNGKIGLVGSTSSQVLVGQVLPNGSADSTFHSFGFGVGSLVGGDQSMLEAVVIRPDGRFLSAGSSSTTDTQYAVLGSMPVSTAGSARDDASIGPGGRRMLPGSAQSPARVLLQPDEKFIVAGGMGNAAVLFRLNKDGTADTNFGTGGKAVVAFAGRSMSASGIALQADGKIVIAASHPSAYGGYGYSGFGVARVGADGKLDPTFGDEGRVLMTKDPDSLNAHVVAVQKDGRIVVAGAIAAFTTPPSGNFVVARYWP